MSGKKIFVFNCPMCNYEFVLFYVRGEAKENGKSHLKDFHQDELRKGFEKNYDGKCKNPNCSYKFHPFKYEINGFNCPNCGWDHKNWYIGYVADICVKSEMS